MKRPNSYRRKPDQDKICPDENILNRLASIGGGENTVYEMKEMDIFPQLIEALKVQTDTNRVCKISSIFRTDLTNPAFIVYQKSKNEDTILNKIFKSNQPNFHSLTIPLIN